MPFFILSCRATSVLPTPLEPGLQGSGKGRAGLRAAGLCAGTGWALSRRERHSRSTVALPVASPFGPAPGPLCSRGAPAARDGVGGESSSGVAHPRAAASDSCRLSRVSRDLGQCPHSLSHSGAWPSPFPGKMPQKAWPRRSHGLREDALGPPSTTDPEMRVVAVSTYITASLYTPPASVITLVSLLRVSVRFWVQDVPRVPSGTLGRARAA